MLIEQAEVVHYQQGIATIRCQIKTNCSGCANQGCGLLVLSLLTEQRKFITSQIATPIPLNIGDRIEIGLPPLHLFFALFWLYVVPLMVFISVAMMFTHLFSHEIIVALGTIMSTVMSYIFIKYYLNSYQMKINNLQFIRKLN